MESSRQAFRREILGRLRRAERVVLCGPRGSGKTRLVLELQNELRSLGVPCGYSAQTGHLEDITQAFARAYPNVDASAHIRRRTARSRLRLAAESRFGVLLLDHVSTVNNAMVGFLRRLVGGVTSVVLVFDVENERERRMLRAGRLGGIPVRMPLMPGPGLRRLWLQQCRVHSLSRPAKEVERRLIHLAAGRPGWIMQCTALATRAHYWRDGRLALVNLLCADSAIVLRYGIDELSKLNESVSKSRCGVSSQTGGIRP